MTKLQTSFNDGSLLMCEKVRGFKNEHSYNPPGYIVLMAWENNKWTTYYYNPAEDIFEYPHHFTDYKEAIKDYKARIKVFLKNQQESKA